MKEYKNIKKNKPRNKRKKPSTRKASNLAKCHQGNNYIKTLKPKPKDKHGISPRTKSLKGPSQDLKKLSCSFHSKYPKYPKQVPSKHGHIITVKEGQCMIKNFR